MPLISCREAFWSTREKSDESHQFCVVLSCFCRERRRSGNFRSSHRIKNNVKVYAQLSVSPLRHLLRVLCGAIIGKCYEATLAKGNRNKTVTWDYDLFRRWVSRGFLGATTTFQLGRSSSKASLLIPVMYPSMGYICTSEEENNSWKRRHRLTASGKGVSFLFFG